MKQPVKKKISVTTQYLVIFGVLIVLTNIILGVVMMIQSTSTIQEMVRKSMLNISNTAAGLLDGDELGALTAESIGSEEYNRIYEQLTVFQDNVDIEFIYAVRREGDTFIFTVDPDPVDPGEFGEEVLVTDALISASKGIPAVDDAPAEDEWGNFYSSYSPVFDSSGKVAGIVGVDYNSEWYDRQIREHTLSIGIITALSVLIGGILILLLTNNLRKRLLALNNELTVLSNDVDMLFNEFTSDRDYQENIAAESTQESRPAPARSDDEIERIGARIRSMHVDLRRYLDFVQAKARTDALTQVGNTTAYIEVQTHLEEQIDNGKADFAVAVFDIDYLKTVNDRYGHKTGDRIIQGAASAIHSAFGSEHTYRIGGDEFIAILEQITEEQMAEKVQLVEQSVHSFNEHNTDLDIPLSISHGTAFYDAGLDHTFKDVFIRADQNMYAAKKQHHGCRD